MFKVGIDIGYSTFKYVVLDKNNKVIKKDYLFHKGKIEKEYNNLLVAIKDIVNDKKIAFGITGSLSSRINLENKYKVNNVIALVEGAIMRNKEVESIIELGAEETKYITNFNSEGSSGINFFVNSSCAAGTGAFLEEQLTRLSIGYDDVESYINKAKQIPRIAGRCSVFSKTDMIHHQQDGVKTEDILLGLCYALARNYKSNVVQKNQIKKPVMLTGGVMNNTGVVKALKDILNLQDKDIIFDEYFYLVSCFGACKISEEKNNFINIDDLKIKGLLKNREDEKSIYNTLADYGYGDSLNKHNVMKKNAKEGYLGVDVGSTSINFVVLDEENEVIDYIYTKTLGEPKSVVLRTFDVLKKRLGENFKIKGVGTTGSGRAFIGKILEADFIVDEITAQAKGATTVDYDVDTIFEIGGQDSKYISLEKCMVKDFEMNKVCAAGTGAFIEEQVKKLGINIEEFSDIALKGKNPSNLGDRCTVFIEGNIGKALTKGEDIENITAGLAYSIVKNYLNRVVGNRKIGDKIFLQGGISHNQAVINAFRVLSGKTIIVPKFFSVTGALGTAILTKEHIEKEDTNKMESTVNSNIETKGNEYFLEGYSKVRSANKKTVGIPRVLFINKMFPMFNTIFKKLGYNVLLSNITNEEIVKLSEEYSFEETCFPVKLINGHVAWLLDKDVDYIFLPQLLTMKHVGSKMREDYACVYMQTSPKIIEGIFDLKSKGIELIAPALSFNFGKEYMIKALLGIGKQLGKSIPETTLAVMSGMKNFFQYEKKLEKLGEQVIENINEDEKVFVIISRVYNIVDPMLNMGIADRLKSMGYKVLNLGHLKANEMKLKEEYNNMYWPFGQHILTGLEVIKNSKNLYPIYITNHGCGPDTILAHYFKKEIGDKPYLHIEVDEHSSKIGVITRIEAFVNSLDYQKSSKENNKYIQKPIISKIPEKDLEVNRVILLPNLYPYSNILKAFLERTGKKVEITQGINDYSIEFGKKFSMSKEYFSLIALIGEVINKVKNSNNEYTLYFPTNEGSETFGQYGKIIKDKVEESGRKISLESPFIEDFLGNKNLGLDFARCIIACDLINLLYEDKKEEYLKLVIDGIRNFKLDDDFLEALSNKVKIEIMSSVSKKRLLIIGEPFVVYKDYLNNGMLKNLSKDNRVIKEPLSEILYVIWRDFSHKRNKINKTYIELIKKYKSSIELVSNQLGEFTPYNSDLDELINVLEDKLPMYAGGAGRYRLAKILTAKNADGIILVSSMYENTATILKILREKYKKDIKVPLLDLYFDSNVNKNPEELLETFINYI
ncbi:CoA activase [Clostridium botulinum]|nr:CoA activase [Clostridium botulinum]